MCSCRNVAIMGAQNSKAQGGAPPRGDLSDRNLYKTSAIYPSPYLSYLQINLSTNIGDLANFKELLAWVC